MKTRLAAVVAASLVLVVLGLPREVSAQSSPLTVSTTGMTCTNGVCDLGTGNVGTFLNLAISASGGSGPTPFPWRVVAGKLPAGLKMAKFFGVESTEITGTPTQVETRDFTVQVTDGAGDTAQQAFSITINPPRPLVITSGSCCPSGTVGTAYHTNFFADGGVQPYTWSISSGQLPPGLKLAKFAPAGLSGNPTTAGSFSFTVTVTDKTGTQTSEAGSITIS
jgi:large repetitive protein